jgi:23S rRNA (cytosine1962-C5)-methyltransferase
LPPTDWQKVDAHFERFSDGDGDWKIKNQKIKEPWQIDIAGLKMQMKLTSFGHLGIFPEQKRNWLQLEEIVGARKRAQPEAPLKVLNLFAYTGGSSLICAKAGAEVAHVDASKGSVTWARENAKLSGLESKPIRWLVDDVQEFVQREIRRGTQYQGIILDPPSYGRGTNKQVWNIEEHLTGFLHALSKLMADDFLFALLSCHSPGYTPTSLQNQLKQMLKGKGGRYHAGEMLIESKAGLDLPSGCSCLWQAER